MKGIEQILIAAKRPKHTGKVFDLRGPLDQIIDGMIDIRSINRGSFDHRVFPQRGQHLLTQKRQPATVVREPTADITSYCHSAR